MWREALNKRPRSGQKDSLKKLKSRAVPQVSRSQSSPCWVCWVGQSGAAWCHAGDAFAGQLEKGSGYIWSQPLTGEHLKRCLVPLTEQEKRNKVFLQAQKGVCFFFTQKLFAESSLLFLFSACFVIYCVRLARGCAVCQESKHADNAAVLCYPEGRAYHAQHFRLAYDSGWLCRLWDNYVFSNLSCVVFCASHIMTAVSNTYTNIDTERYLYTSILCWLDGNTPKMTWIICDECVFEEISSQCVKRFKCVC